MLIPTILSGGSGSRLWPLSRQLFPKQFLALAGEHSLLQTTALRLAGLPVERLLFICNDEHRFMVAEQCREINIEPLAVVLEPVGRNTAPAVAVAALQALLHDQDALLLILPADHVIKNIAAFHTAVERALPVAKEGKLVTFGIAPQSAETGYGYIKRGAELDSGGFVVERFVEKPDQTTAQGYLDAGTYYWNSGMFLFRAERYLQELETHQPAMLAACRQALEQARRDLDFIRLDKDAFAGCANISIDYAVMEHTRDAVVIPLLDAGWSDIGSWAALWQISEQDEADNVLLGDVIAQDSRACFARSEDRLLTLLGVEDLIVVDTKDAVLVASKAHIQGVKKIVDQLQGQGRSHALLHRQVYRPWGYYDSIDQGQRFQVKRISVKPGAQLSLQMHHHRAEHWVVVRGTAKVTRGEEVFLLHENESTYINPGQLHRLENPGKIRLELIEVQTGSYLGEDDIVRLQDAYRRNE